MSGMAASLRALTEQGRLFCTLGVVHIEAGADRHWDVTEDGELTVSVLLDAHEVPVWALWAGVYGVFRIPKPGTEVVVAQPSGEIEGGSIIVGVLPTGHVPDDIDDAALSLRDRRIVIGATGAAEPLVLGASWKAMMESLLDLLATLTMPATPGTAGPPSPATQQQLNTIKQQLNQQLSGWVFTQRSAPEE